MSEPRGPECLPAECRPRLACGARCQQDRLSGDWLLLFPEGVLRLNDTGAAILRLCDGRHALGDIAVLLAARYRGGGEGVYEDVADYVGRLRDRSLVTFAPDDGDAS